MCTQKRRVASHGEPEGQGLATRSEAERGEANRRGQGPLQVLFLALIRAYQLCISPFTPPACRFTPTCSHYAAEAITRHGACKGGLLAIKRLARCHPWGGMGDDPVP